MGRIEGPGLTYDDVLLVPRKASNLPRDVCTKTRFCRQVELQIPVASAAMDTVTEARLAIALSLQGGIGVIHKNLSVTEQIAEVDKVKRSANGVIVDPVTLSPEATVGEAKDLMRGYKIGGLPVVDEAGRVRGILTNRDLRFVESRETLVSDVMTSENLVTAPPDTDLERARASLQSAKVEKLILQHPDGRLAGLITIKDINMTEEFPSAAKDSRGRLLVGAAVGVHDLERVSGLVGAGCDVIVVDTAHGHSDNVLQTVRAIKRVKPDAVVLMTYHTTEVWYKDLIRNNSGQQYLPLHCIMRNADGTPCDWWVPWPNGIITTNMFLPECVAAVSHSPSRSSSDHSIASRVWSRCVSGRNALSQSNIRSESSRGS